MSQRSDFVAHCVPACSLTWVQIRMPRQGQSSESVNGHSAAGRCVAGKGADASKSSNVVQSFDGSGGLAKTPQPERFEAGVKHQGRAASLAERRELMKRRRRMLRGKGGDWHTPSKASYLLLQTDRRRFFCLFAVAHCGPFPGFLPCDSNFLRICASVLRTERSCSTSSNADESWSTFGWMEGSV